MKHEDVVKRLRTDPEFVVAEIALLEADVAKWKALARELAEALDEATNELIEDLASYGVSYQELPRGKRKCDVLDKARAAGLLEE